jgi:glycosyltransferase involved in cell wall biosynthesis
MVILSILIPVINEDRPLLPRLLNELNRQMMDGVEIILDEREPPVTTGQKRNELIQKATGKYIVFVDSDDLILDGYIREILHAATSDTDCITFKGYMTTNGSHRQNFILRLGEKYESRNGIYYRWPNHITPIKRSIAERVKFPHITTGEDYHWSKSIADYDFVKSEVHIPKDLYWYDCRPAKHTNVKHTRIR